MSFRGAAAIVTALSLAGAGCASRTQKGAVVGAGDGGTAGAVVGHATGSTLRGAILAAAVGGAAGALIGRRMDQQAERLRRELKNAKVSRVGEGIAVTFESGILFPFDSATLQRDGRENLRTLSASLKDEPRTEVLILGHTDSVGESTYNQGLSERRAVASANYLSAQGIRRRRVWTNGRGETEPLASNDSDAGRRQNRRVEVAIFASEEWRQQARREAAERK